MKRINQFLILFSFFVLAEFSFAKKLYLIENSEINTNSSIENLQNKIKAEIKRTFPKKMTQQRAVSANTDDVISISFGIDSLKENISNSHVVDIATLVTQTEIKFLTLKYPQALKSTSIIFKGSSFQCQMSFYKDFIAKDASTKLGILLFQNSRMLLPDIENYAKKHLIDIKIFTVKNNESVIRGLHNLLIKYSTVILLANSKVEQTKNLSAIFHEAKLSNRNIIASTYYQKQLGGIGPCALDEKELIKNIIQSIRNKID